jgi:hypothetical protein
MKEIPVGKLRMSSTFSVFDSQPNFRWNSTGLRFSDCYMQSRLNWCHYQFFLFRGDAAGLSVAIRYGASKRYAPTRNLITTNESSCDGSLPGLHFWARILNQITILTIFSSFWISYENRQLRLTQSRHWGRLLFHCPKTYQVVLLFKTLPTGHFAWVFPRLAASSPFHRAWAKVKVPW